MSPAVVARRAAASLAFWSGSCGLHVFLDEKQGQGSFGLWRHGSEIPEAWKGAPRRKNHGGWLIATKSTLRSRSRCLDSMSRAVWLLVAGP